MPAELTDIVDTAASKDLENLAAVFDELMTIRTNYLVANKEQEIAAVYSSGNED
jgi:hypothetical protein